MPVGRRPLCRTSSYFRRTELRRPPAQFGQTDSAGPPAFGVLWFAQNGGAQRESEAPVEAPQPRTFVAKKSKAAAKKGTGTTQWAILQQSGIPPEDIPQFRFAPASSHSVCNSVCSAFATHAIPQSPQNSPVHLPRMRS